jgi:hypothetical protein
LILRETELFKAAEARLHGLDNQATAVSAAGLVLAPLVASAMWDYLDPISLIPTAVHAGLVAAILTVLAVTLGAVARLLVSPRRSGDAAADDRVTRSALSDDPLKVKRAVLRTWSSRRIAADRSVALKTRCVRAALVCLLGAGVSLGVAFFALFDTLKESLLY